MCETHAYVVRGGREELVMEDVVFARPREGKAEKIFSGRIKEIQFLGHKILIE
jgi:predicted RNA-binding protein